MRAAWCACLVSISVVALAACATSQESPGGDWYRLYAGPTDLVWRTTLEVLADEGYVVDASDVGQGRIRAHSGDELGIHGIELILELTTTDNLVRVSVGARGGDTGPGGHRRMDEAVDRFLRRLDEGMRAARGGDTDPDGL